MTIPALSAAKRVCEKSGWSLSNLKLQKILYIAHMFRLGKTGKPLVSGHFEAWDYGPVHPTVYHKVKIFGSSPVTNIFHSVPEPEDADELDVAVSELSNYTSVRLVAITHWDKGAWAKNYFPGNRGNLIPDEDIIQEFRDRIDVIRKKQHAR